MRLPSKTSDRYELIVVTDTGNTVYEHLREDNNRRVSGDTILVAALPRPDLQISEIVAPDRVTAGATASVEFKVVNLELEDAHGTRTAKTWMSHDDKLTDEAILLSRPPNTTAAASTGEITDPTGRFLTYKPYENT